MKALFPIAAVLLLAACTPDIDLEEGKPLKPLTLTTKQQTFVDAGNDFSFRFLDEVEAVTGEDYVISPLSMQFLLGMILDGAKGATADEICATLGYGEGEAAEVDAYARTMLDQLPAMDNKTKLTMANAIIVDQGFTLNDSYSSNVREFYDAEVSNLPFSDREGSAAIINKWCSDHTEGLIPKILDETDPDMLAYLLNALYFKSQWRSKFDVAATSEEKFSYSDGSTGSVKMMRQYTNFSYAETDWFQAVNLPYGNGAFVMTVLLPKGKFTTEQAARYFCKNSWSDFRNSMMTCSVDLWLPRFETAFGIRLNDLLSKMGMPLAFIPEADFSQMSPYALCLSFVRQDAVIKVDEEGTEAAAVSSAGVYKNTSVGNEAPPVIFHADHPFVYIISEQSSGAVLFAGKYGGKKKVQK